MNKRIFSGLFVLSAIGALTIIVARAITEGDQLLVRFLTAVVVAALGLYIVSDLRLQSKSRKKTRQELERQFEIDLTTFDTNETTTAGFLSNSRASVAERQLETAGAGSAPGVGGTVVGSFSDFDLDELRDLALEDDLKADRFSSERSSNEDLVDLVEGLPHVESNDLDDTSFDWPATDEWDSPEVVVGLDPEQVLSVEEGINEFSEPDFSRGLTVVDGDETINLVPQVEVYETSEPELIEPEPVVVPDPEPEIVEEVAVAETVQTQELSTTADVDPPTPEVASAVVPKVDKPELGERVDFIDLSAIVDLKQARSVEFKSSVDSAIVAGERTVVDTLMSEGMLTAEGPLTDRDVRTMVYVAFTSNELRKLINASAQADGTYPDLGPVELFDESIHRAAPQIMYNPET